MAVLVGIGSFILFLFFQAQGIYTGDSGDLATAAVVHGVPHPPGYPLYTLLGFLFSRLPLLTPAWRVTLMSSVPHAIVIGLVYLFVFRLTKNRLAGVFSSLALLGNYLFFLYAVTPEVFALLDLFVMLLLYEAFLYQNTRSIFILSIMALTFGFALTHHHVIIFAVPAFFYLIISIGFPKHFGIREMFRIIGIFVIGLLPYLYAPVAGSTNAIINWDKPTTVVRFIQLLTRQDYGSFVSGGFIGHSFAERIISIKAYFSFLFLDFTLVGVLILGVGLFAWWKKDQLFTRVVAMLLFLFGPFFFFYASFPIVSRFTLGTYERFLLPSYCIYAVLLGVGFHAMQQLVIGKVRFHKIGVNAVVVLCSAILFLYPLTIFTITLYRFTGLSEDRTAENLGRDILMSLPDNAILLLSQDTTLFTTQFVRYGLNVRPDTIVLHASRIAANDYKEVISTRFPSIKFPETASQHFIGDFIMLNKQDHRIFVNATLSVESGWYFIPHGLVYEIVRSDELLPIAKLRQQNNELFGSYSDPTLGILSRYKHLMLSDVLDVYAWSHINYGKTLVRATAYEDAIVEFEKAASLGGDSSKSEAYTYLGVSYAVVGRCTDALDALKLAKETSVHIKKPEYVLYESITHRDCLKDATRAASLFSEYEKLKKSDDTPLQSL